MDQDQEQLVQFIKTLDDCQPTEEVLKWLNECCATNNELSIVNQLIISFLKSLENVQYINSILKCLKKLNDWIPELVKPQLLKNEHFPKAIIEYFTKLNIHDYIAEGLIMLSLIFEEKKFNKLADEQFANALLNSLEFVDNEDIFKCIVLIIVKLGDQPSVVETCVKHPKIRFFQEYLLQYLNKQDKDIKQPILFIEKLLQVDNNFFYQNDCRVLQELSIRQIEDGDDGIRQLYIRNLYVMVQNIDKDKLLIDRIKDTMQLVQQNCKDKYSQTKAKQVLEKLD